MNNQNKMTITECELFVLNLALCLVEDGESLFQSRDSNNPVFFYEKDVLLAGGGLRVKKWKPTVCDTDYSPRVSVSLKRTHEQPIKYWFSDDNQVRNHEMCLNLAMEALGGAA